MLAALACTCVMVLTVTLSIFVGVAAGESRRRRGFVVATLILLGWVAGLATVAAAASTDTPLVTAGLAFPLIALCALGVTILSTPLRRLGFSPVVVLTFAAAASILIVAPVHWAIFSVAGPLQATFRTLDLAGAVAALFAPSVAALTVLSIEHFARSRMPGVLAGVVPARRSRPRSTFVFALVAPVSWVVWIGWMLGMELALNDVSGRIAVNGIVAPLASVAAWLLVERIRHAATTRTAAVMGMIAGLAAITPACGYVDTVGAVTIGVLAGAVGSLVAHALASQHAGAAWLIPTSLCLGASVGVVSIGIFSTRVGIAYTGQPELLFSQVLSLATTAGYTIVVAAVLWLMVRRLSRKPAPTVVA